MEFTNKYIIPISIACLLVSACHLNEFFMYMFVSSFAALSIAVYFKTVSFLDRLNVFNEVARAVLYTVSMISTSHNKHWVRVALHIFIIYICLAGPGLIDKYHVDILEHIESITRFLTVDKLYIYDIPKLIESIHVWLNSIVLSQVTSSYAI